MDPFGSGLLAGAVGVAAAAGACLRPRVASRILVVVLPWAALNVPINTLLGAPRYGALPLGGVAGLAACALAAVSRRAPVAGAAASVALVAGGAGIGAGPITALATGASPSVAVIDATRRPPYDRGALVYDSALRMHVSRLLPDREQSEIVTDRAVVAAAGDVVLTADRRVRGLASERAFGRRDPILARISPGLLLETRIGIAPSRLSVGTRPAGPDVDVIRYDASIPVAIDAPAEGAVLRGALEVRGWGQLRGGGAVEPVEFRVDGALLPILRLERTPRPDVAATIPEIGDATRAGYTATLDAPSLAPGQHDLKVAFRTRDGRHRIAGPVRFIWAP